MVLDSHTLLWWLERSGELSATARTILGNAANGDEVFQVAAVSFWELYRKELRGKLSPKISVRRCPPLLGQIEWINQVDDSPENWLAMAELDWSHHDPADRLIATIARQRGLAVVKRARRFHAADSPVEAIW